MITRTSAAAFFIVALIVGVAAPTTAAPNPLLDEPECTITGTDERDELTGTSGNDVICGLDGHDWLVGGGGNDIFRGGGGYDLMDTGLGDDTVIGGPGMDSIGFTGDAASGQVIDFEEGTSTGGYGTDQIISVSNTQGTPFADEIVGHDGRNLIAGDEGNDVLIGGDGRDRLNGGKGKDEVDGRDGAPGDVLGGGNGTGDDCLADEGDILRHCS